MKRKREMSLQLQKVNRLPLFKFAGNSIRSHFFKKGSFPPPPIAKEEAEAISSFPCESPCQIYFWETGKWREKILRPWPRRIRKEGARENSNRLPPFFFFTRVINLGNRFMGPFFFLSRRRNPIRSVPLSYIAISRTSPTVVQCSVRMEGGDEGKEQMGDKFFCLAPEKGKGDSPLTHGREIREKRRRRYCKKNPQYLCRPLNLSSLNLCQDILRIFPGLDKTS